MSNDVLEDKLAKTLKTLQKTRDELTTSRAILRKLGREDAFIDRLVKNVNTHIRIIKPTKIPAITYDENTLEYGNIIGVSDWHIGEIVDPKQVGGVNTFNYKASKKRIDKHVRKTLDKLTRSENLIVADLGDNIRGMIHGGIEDSEDGIMESLVKCTDYIASMLITYLEYYKHIDYYFVVGNHSRLDDKIVAKNKYKDYSWLVVQMLIRLFKDEPRIKFNISETGYHLVKVNTVNIMLFHGDTVRWYNPSSDVSRSKLQDICQNMFNKRATHFFSGHRHIANTIANQYGGFNIVSGTLVGNNEYGVQNGFSMIHPSQCTFNVEADGAIEELYHFIL